MREEVSTVMSKLYLNANGTIDMEHCGNCAYAECDTEDEPCCLCSNGSGENDVLLFKLKDKEEVDGGWWSWRGLQVGNDD